MEVFFVILPMRLFTLFFLAPLYLFAQAHTDVAKDALYVALDNTHFATMDTVEAIFDLKELCAQKPDACVYQQVEAEIGIYHFNLFPASASTPYFRNLKIYTIQDSIFSFKATAFLPKNSIWHVYGLSSFNEAALEYQNRYNRQLPYSFFGIRFDDDSDIVYGSGCSVSGAPPKQWTTMTKAVQQKDTTLLEDWLYSLHPEYEAYGATGIFFLRKLDFELNKKLIDKAEKIRKLKRPLLICAGCMYYTSKNYLTLDDATLLSEFEYYNEAGFFTKNPHRAFRKFSRKQRRKLKKQDRQASKQLP
jgi:hypothetical protein